MTEAERAYLDHLTQTREHNAATMELHEHHLVAATEQNAILRAIAETLAAMLNEMKEGR